MNQNGCSRSPEYAIVKGYPVKKHDNKLVTIGHSFGGAALFSSIKGVLAGRYVHSRPFGTTNSVSGYGDLVLIMNPAFESLQYQSLYELSQDECRPYPETQLPKLIIMSANEDKAVRWLFKPGRFASTFFFEKHRNTTAKYCRTITDENSEYNVEQWHGDILGVGHHDAYVTHFLKRSKSPKEHSLAKKSASLTATWVDQIKKGEVHFRNGLILVSKDRVVPMNPYLNIFTQDGIMEEGHNDIWNKEVRSFIDDIIGVSTTLTQ